MATDRRITHTGLTVSARHVGPGEQLTEQEQERYDADRAKLSSEEFVTKYGAGHYEFFVEMDGVPVVIGSRKAGTIDRRRAALKKAAADQAAAAAAADTTTE